MTKQEEIREGLISTLGWVQANMALSYLHSQGVVIKVDGELPFVTSSYVPSEHGVYVRINAEALSEQGYEAVEPLIKE